MNPNDNVMLSQNPTDWPVRTDIFLYPDQEALRDFAEKHGVKELNLIKVRTAVKPVSITVDIYQDGTVRIVDHQLYVDGGAFLDIQNNA